MFNDMIQYALSFVSRNFIRHPGDIYLFPCAHMLPRSQVASESIKIYAAIDSGILNLVNKVRI